MDSYKCITLRLMTVIQLYVYTMCAHTAALHVIAVYGIANTCTVHTCWIDCANDWKTRYFGKPAEVVKSTRFHQCVPQLSRLCDAVPLL